ncbi:MAG: membrane protein insertase YidC [Betaproteobacteria bacterium]|nr:membrane protein insertase YidC [Betaproteobacteria bacterium]
MDIQRLIALVVFSASAFLLWDGWQKHNAPKAPAQQAATAGNPGAGTAPTPTSPLASQAAPGVQGAPPVAPGAPAAAPVEATGQPVVVKTDLFEVELNTAGGDIRRVTLFKVFSALDHTQPLTLLSPDPKQYFVTQSGLLGDGLPTHKTMYSVESTVFALENGQDQLELRLVAKDAGGDEVVKKFLFHRGSYEMLVTYEVRNGGDKPIAPYAYFQFLRDGNHPSQAAAQTSAFAGVATFTGPAVYTDEAKFVKIDFKDIDKGKQAHVKKAKDGWIALVQHYFVSAWLPAGTTEREFFTNKVGDNLYAAGVIVPVGAVAAGAKATVSLSLYIGPQETEKLAKIAPGLELVVDYGWLKIIAAPLFWVLKFIHGLVGNWGWAIILLTILIKLVFYPLNHKAGRSMAAMKVLGPKMEKLKQLYGDDRQKLNQAMMELYRTEKINPLGGCLPIVVQIPVFIALYWVLLGSIELRHAPWLGWIQDLSGPDPYYILPVIYAVSMFVQTKLNPQPADPVQAKVMLAMPIVFSVFFLFFPSGLVLYWVVQNLLSIAQQWHINRSLVAEAAAKARGKH